MILTTISPYHIAIPLLRYIRHVLRWPVPGVSRLFLSYFSIISQKFLDYFPFLIYFSLISCLFPGYFSLLNNFPFVSQSLPDYFPNISYFSILDLEVAILGKN